MATGRDDQDMREVDEPQDGNAPRGADSPGSPRRDDRSRDRDGRLQIYNVHSLNSRLWDNSRDRIDVSTWPESAWAYAARYDYFMDTWMLLGRDTTSTIWGRKRFIRRCNLCSGSISIFNVDGDNVSHTHYCTTTTRVLGGFNPETGTVTCSICRVGIHPYRTGMRRPVLVVDGFLGDTVQSLEWAGWDRYHIDVVQIDEANIDEIFHALLTTFEDSDKPCDFLIAGGWFKSLVQRMTIAEIIYKCTRFAAKIREAFRDGTNGGHSTYPSSVCFVPLAAPPLLGAVGPVDYMSDNQYDFMQNISHLANQLIHLNRLHASCGEYMGVDTMLSLEWWGRQGRGEDSTYRDSQWSRQVRPPRQSQRDRNLENTGSNKRPRRDAVK